VVRKGRVRPATRVSEVLDELEVLLKLMIPTSVPCAVGRSVGPPVSEGLWARFGGPGCFTSYRNPAKQMWPTQPSKIILSYLDIKSVTVAREPISLTDMAR
jgi:hypothetical protein